MLGLRAWGDGLNGILFEFLDDDTKLAQSCRNWLYVQHWYVEAPDHVESCKKTFPTCPSCPARLPRHVSVLLCVLPGLPRLKKRTFFFWEEEGKGDGLGPRKVFLRTCLDTCTVGNRP